MPYVYLTIIFYMLHYILLYKSLIHRRLLIILILTLAALAGLLVDFKNPIISERLKHYTYHFLQCIVLMYVANHCEYNSQPVNFGL